MSFNDDFQFRPASKGLGFHNPNIKQALKATHPQPTNISSIPLKNPIIGNGTTHLLNSKAKTRQPSLPRSSNLVKASLVSETLTATAEELQGLESASSAPTLYARFFSWAIDIISLVLLISLSSSFIFQLNNLTLTDPMEFFNSDFILNLYLPMGLGFYMFYFMLFERVTGQTLGKLIMGLKVVRLNTDLPPTLWQSFIRNIFNLISFATMGLLTVYDIVNWSLGLKVVKVGKN